MATHHHRVPKEDPDWVYRLERYFEHMDREQNGFLTIEYIQLWASSLEKKCKVTPGEMVALRATLYEYWGAMGLKKDVVMTKSDFIDGLSTMAMEDVRRKKKGELTLLDQVSDAWYDAIDQDNDENLTLEELEDFMVATKMNTAGAKLWMKHLDRDHSGGIDKEEYKNAEYKFWYKSHKHHKE